MPRLSVAYTGWSHITGAIAWARIVAGAFNVMGLVSLIATIRLVLFVGGAGEPSTWVIAAYGIGGALLLCAVGAFLNVAADTLALHRDARPTSD